MLSLLNPPPVARGLNGLTETSNLFEPRVKGIERRVGQFVEGLGHQREELTDEILCAFNHLELQLTSALDGSIFAEPRQAFEVCIAENVFNASNYFASCVEVKGVQRLLEVITVYILRT
ncbi:MAG: hypothetical protein VX160_07635 [Actinomycetota bacterium]|nr:hypothetical protein [Actinomycetota bacterium]